MNTEKIKELRFSILTFLFYIASNLKARVTTEYKQHSNDIKRIITYCHFYEESKPLLKKYNAKQINISSNKKILPEDYTIILTILTNFLDITRDIKSYSDGYEKTIQSLIDYSIDRNIEYLPEEEYIKYLKEVNPLFS